MKSKTRRSRTRQIRLRKRQWRPRKSSRRSQRLKDAIERPASLPQFKSVQKSIKLTTCTLLVNCGILLDQIVLIQTAKMRRIMSLTSQIRRIWINNLRDIQSSRRLTVQLTEKFRKLMVLQPKLGSRSLTSSTRRSMLASYVENLSTWQQHWAVTFLKHTQGKASLTITRRRSGKSVWWKDDFIKRLWECTISKESL